MGLSNSLPNSILQPGVCTSTTRPASPYEGQVIFETDTNSTLSWSGTAWVAVSDDDTLHIDTANNLVGINDTTPSYTLDVNGDINYTGTLRKNGAVNDVGLILLSSTSGSTTSQSGAITLPSSYLFIQNKYKLMITFSGIGLDNYTLSLGHSIGTVTNGVAGGFCERTDSSFSTLQDSFPFLSSNTIHKLPVGHLMNGASSRTFVEYNIQSESGYQRTVYGVSSNSFSNQTDLSNSRAGRFHYGYDYYSLSDYRFNTIHYDFGTTPSQTVQYSIKVYKYA